MKKRRDKEYVERMKNIGEFCLEINSNDRGCSKYLDCN